MRWNFKFFGNVPSKKNSRIITKARGRVVSIPSKKYREWHKEVSAQLDEAGGVPPKYDSRVRITCRFWLDSNRRKDLDNEYASILDWLQDVGILEDDRWQIVSESHLYAMGIDRENPRVEIEIEDVRE